MAIKFKMISDEDVKTIRAARKALTRIAKKLRRLNAVHDRVLLADPSKDYTTVALANWRMLDEVEALGVSSFDDNMLSIRLLPSGREAEEIRL